MAVLEKKLYDLKEVAEVTGLALGSIRQYVSYGIIPAIYLGTRRMVRAEVVEKICTEGLDTRKDKAV